MVDEHDARLGLALKEAGYPASVVEKVRAGHWSDFKTELPMPKMDLVQMLHTDGHIELADRVTTGEFDG